MASLWCPFKPTPKRRTEPQKIPSPTRGLARLRARRAVHLPLAAMASRGMRLARGAVRGFRIAGSTKVTSSKLPFDMVVGSQKYV